MKMPRIRSMNNKHYSHGQEELHKAINSFQIMVDLTSI